MGKRLDGKTAIITGAGRGIGRAIAKELAEVGANIVIDYSRSTEPAHELASELDKAGVKTLLVQADVTDYTQVSQLFKQTIEAFGQIDILVNNAGITRDKTLKNMTLDNWTEVVHADLDSVFNCTKQVLPFMLERKQGRVINISSFVAQGGNIGQSNYAAAKAGIIGFTKAVALEVSRYGITINAVCPGFTETDMLSAVPDNIRQRILERIPLGRFGTSEEVAACVRFLAAEGAYITGQAINVNGGIYI